MTQKSVYLNQKLTTKKSYCDISAQRNININYLIISWKRYFIDFWETPPE